MPIVNSLLTFVSPTIPRFTLKSVAFVDSNKGWVSSVHRVCKIDV